MGTWDNGPFDNDTAADFAGDLDDAEPGEREALVRGVLTRTVDATGWLAEGEEAVAAAALIAAQCPGGDPLDTPYGPEEPMPAFLTISGRSRTRLSIASSATRPGRPRTGSTRKTGSNGEPTSTAFVRSLLHHHRQSRCSMSSSDIASPITNPEPEPDLVLAQALGSGRGGLLRSSRQRKGSVCDGVGARSRLSSAVPGCAGRRTRCPPDLP